VIVVGIFFLMMCFMVNLLKQISFIIKKKNIMAIKFITGGYPPIANKKKSVAKILEMMGLELDFALSNKKKANIIKNVQDKQLSVINAKYNHDIVYGDVVINKLISIYEKLFSGSLNNFNKSKEPIE
jgi:hypothetical protein